jgi:hypothetical protein
LFNGSNGHGGGFSLLAFFWRSSGFFWRSSGVLLAFFWVLLAFFCVIERQKNARRQRVDFGSAELDLAIWADPADLEERDRT